LGFCSERVDGDTHADAERANGVVSGNLAQVFVKLERQNVRQYLIDPLRDASDKAFVG
jgi:hypothetical protein